MTVKELIAKLGLNFDEKEFDRADKALKGISSAARTLVQIFAAGAIAQGLKSIVYGAVDAADNIANLAQRLGTTTQELQELGYAAQLANMTEETLGISLQHLARNAAEAGAKGGQTGKAFAALGVRVRGADGEVRPVNELLRDVADGMAGMTNDTERVRVSMQLFGRDGARMINMLQGGSAELDAIGVEAREAGAVMSGEFIAAAQKVDANTKRLHATITGLRTFIASKLLPVVNWLVEAFAGLVRWVTQSTKGTKLIEIALVAVGAAAGLLAFTLTMKLLGAIAALNVSLVALAAKFGIAGGAALLMQLKASLIGLAMLALLAIIWLVGDEIATFFSGGETMMGKWATKLEEIYDWFMAIGTEGPTWMKVLMAPLQGLLWVVNEVLKALSGVYEFLAFQDTGIFKHLGGEWMERLRGLPGVGGLFGGGAPATASASQGAVTSSAVVAPTMNTSVEVNAAPGQSPEAVGTAVARAVDERYQAMLNDAAATLPLAPIPGR